MSFIVILFVLPSAPKSDINMMVASAVLTCLSPQLTEVTLSSIKAVMMEIVFGASNSISSKTIKLLEHFASWLHINFSISFL